MVMQSPEGEEQQRQAKQACAKERAEWIATMSIQDFRDAVENKGPLAFEWRDTPDQLIHDLCNAVDNASVPIFAVYAKSPDKPTLLGYATGSQDDIKAFYNDRKGYGLILKQIEAQNIPPGFAAKRQRLLEDKARYQKEIDNIDQQLKRTGG